MNALFLAFAYLRYHWARSLILVAVTALILFVPLATQILLATSERRLTARADDTPLVLGSRGSQLDLTMNALYFSDERPEPIAMSAVEAIWDSGLALPIPLNTAFSAEGARIVGTSLDYFDFRGLTVVRGRQLAVLGEAVVGAEVAARLGKGVNDTLVSSPENLFDLDGIYPLELPIVGVLARTNTPDDETIFVDIKTTWVIAGIGHGHEDVLTQVEIGSADVAAAADIVQYNRITPENIDSFHFHGDPEGNPVSAVIVAPYDARAATVLRGRYLDPESATQMVVPQTVIEGLVDRIFRIKALLDAVTAVIGLAALAAVALAMFLSFRLRSREMQTAFKLGARRGMILQLLSAETALLLSSAAAIALTLTLTVNATADDWVTWILNVGSQPMETLQ